MNSHQALDRAKALFKKEERLREGQQAMAEYEADRHAVREKTARLRALRLARDAANHLDREETLTKVTTRARRAKPSRSVGRSPRLIPDEAASVGGLTPRADDPVI